MFAWSIYFCSGKDEFAIDIRCKRSQFGLDFWIFVTFEILNENCSFDFLSKNSIQVVFFMSSLVVWKGFHYYILYITFRISPHVFIVGVTFRDGIWYLRTYSAQAPHFPHLVNVNECLALRREWKNLRSVKYYKLLLRDLNAIAVGSIVDFKCDDNEHNHDNGKQTEKEIQIARAILH